MVSMKDIAQHLHLSRCTVSNILNDRLQDKSYRKETIELVRNTAKEMGYVSNRLAKSLKTGSTGTIAIVVPDIANTFYIKIIKEVERQANRFGYSLIICMAEEILEKENSALIMLQSRCVDGVLISPVSYRDSLQKEYPFKIVCFDRAVEGDRFPHVLIDNRAAGYTLTEKLLNDGARAPLFLAGSCNDYTVKERFEGFCDALRAHGTTPNAANCLTGIYEEQAAHRAMLEAIDAGLEFDSVLLCTNYFVYGVLRALRASRRQIVSIGGFERFGGRDLFMENMHIIDQPEEEMGRAAFSMLYKLLNGEQAESQLLQHHVF